MVSDNKQEQHLSDERTNDQTTALTTVKRDRESKRKRLVNKERLYGTVSKQ